MLNEAQIVGEIFLHKIRSYVYTQYELVHNVRYSSENVTHSFGFSSSANLCTFRVRVVRRNFPRPPVDAARQDQNLLQPQIDPLP